MGNSLPDGSFLKAPLNLLKRADGGAGPSADLHISAAVGSEERGQGKVTGK